MCSSDGELTNFSVCRAYTHNHRQCACNPRSAVPASIILHQPVPDATNRR
jgi:hypothetical protein